MIEPTTIFRRFNELETTIWPPPHGYELRIQASQQIKDEILAELSLHPENPTLIALLAHATERLDQPESARKIAQSVLDTPCRTAEAQSIALCVLASCEDHAHYQTTQQCYSPLATTYYRQAVEADPWNEQAAALLAERIWDGCGEPDEARAIINKAVQNSPSSPRVLQTAIYIKRLSGGPFDEVLGHLKALAQLKPLAAGECSTFAVASAKLGDYHAALEWCLKGQHTENTSNLDLPNRHQRQRPGINDPCINTITTNAINNLAIDPTNLELQCFVALCFWFLPAIGASLVADILLEQIDTSAPGKLGLLAGNATTKLNAELQANAIHFQVKNPWPYGQPVGPFGRMVHVSDMRASWKPEDLN